MLQLYACRFVFEAIDRVQFAPGGAANTFRGAFGHIFRRTACRPECPGAKQCERREECAYARLFEPVCREGPSGLADAPRPFTIRAAAVDGRGYEPGERFAIDVHVFDLSEAARASFPAVFAALAEEGIGQGRGRVRLHECPAPVPVSLPLEAETSAPGEITLRFATPTELKHEGRVAAEAPFGLVLARARDRISTLCMLYGAGALDIDFQGMGERAAAVRTVASDLRWETGARRSSRTGQTHPLGGMVGEVRYAGELREFLPYLKAAWWTGIGRQTTWGKGVIEVVRA